MDARLDALHGARLRPADTLLGLLVVAMWGVNFAVMRYCIQGIPPMLLGALRFTLVVLPAIFFVRPPPVPLRFYLAYGLTLSFAQPALLYLAIRWGMPSGLASLVLQSQAMFTLLLVSAWLKEPCRPTQLGGLALAAAGMVLIGAGHGVAMPLAGFVLTALAAAMWAVGNVVTRVLAAGAPVDPLGFVAWSSLVPIPPFLLLSYALEGPAAIAASLRAIDLGTGAAVLFLSWAATLLGYAIWSRLLSRYRAGSVAPLSLLVPFIGLAVGWAVFDEQLAPLHVWGGLTLMLGLAVNFFGLPATPLALLRRGLHLMKRRTE